MRKRVKLGIVLVPLGAAVIGGTVLYVTDHQTVNLYGGWQGGTSSPATINDS